MEHLTFISFLMIIKNFLLCTYVYTYTLYYMYIFSIYNTHLQKHMFINLFIYSIYFIYHKLFNIYVTLSVKSRLKSHNLIMR